MKKILLVISFCFVSFSIYAQTDSLSIQEKSFKAQAKNFATELNVNPFKGELSLNNSLNQIKFRLFTASNYAWRLGFIANSTGSIVENNNPYGTNSYHYKDDRSSTTLGVNIGIEKHFTGTKRLSPYAGIDFILANKSTKQEVINGQTTITRTGAWISSIYDGNSQTQQIAENGFLRFGVNLVTGFDFYIARHFFFGYELNFGFNQTNWQNIEETQTGSTNSYTQPVRQNTTFTFGPSLMNGIRLGYVL